jgi:acetone carboxylase gamma subunit
VGRLLLWCPNERKLVETPFAFTREQYERIDLGDENEWVSNALLCPECGELHEWDKSNTLLRPD